MQDSSVSNLWKVGSVSYWLIAETEKVRLIKTTIENPEGKL